MELQQTQAAKLRQPDLQEVKLRDLNISIWKTTLHVEN